MKNEELCGCYNVTLSDVKEHIKNGVSKFEDLQGLTNIGTGCTPCKESNEKLFNELLEQKDRL